MRLFRVFTVLLLLLTATPRPAGAGVAAKSLQGVFSSEECESVPELPGASGDRRHLLGTAGPAQQILDGGSRSGRKRETNSYSKFA